MGIEMGKKKGDEKGEKGRGPGWEGGHRRGEDGRRKGKKERRKGGNGRERREWKGDVFASVKIKSRVRL